MTGRLQGWLARLSDPSGPNDNWAPPPFRSGESERLASLIDLASRHNVRPAVVANLERQFKTAPADLLTDLDAPARDAFEAVRRDAQNARFGDMARAMLLERTAKEVLSRTQRHGLALALVKGIDFANEAYGGLQLRTFSDIDLLVDPASQAPLGEVLADLGFEELMPHKMRLEKSERQWIRRDGHDNVLLVEVHTDMVHDPSLRRYSTLTYRLYADPANGGITPAARLVLAALHGATSHLFGRLQYVVDGLMIARMGADPNELRERARQCGCILPLATMLRLGADLYGCAECQSLLAKLGPIRWDRLQRRLIRPTTVLAAKDRDRWRLLPQRYLYRRLLRTGRPIRQDI